MIATIRNSKTNIVMGKYLARCKWDSNSKKITDYGDNTKIMIVLNVYEEALSKASKGTGVFYISKDQYKNNFLWDTEKLDKNNFTQIFSKIDNINYYYYEYSSSKDESYFEEMKNSQINNIKKVINGTDVTIHISEIVTDDELSTANELTKYINSELYIANDDNLNNLIEYLKKSGLYYTETMHLSD